MEIESGIRRKIKKRLENDLGKVEEIDVRSAVLCGEMGCGDMADFISGNSELRCPYGGRIENPEEACRRLHEEYQEAIQADADK